jgi:integrase/recombinase XerD
MAGLERAQWSSAAPIRAIFREAFAAAGLPYFNPHSFRKTLVQLGQAVCQTPEQFKAWSQNLGHEGVLTTFYSYGEVASSRQGEIIKSLAHPKEIEPAGVKDLAKALMREMRLTPFAAPNEKR